MAFRILTLVLVVLLALPHPGRGVVSAGMDHAAHSHHMPVSPVKGTPAGGHGDSACVTVCLGSPVIEVVQISAPVQGVVYLWLGFGGPVPGALATPATLTRPPNPPILT